MTSNRSIRLLERTILKANLVGQGVDLLDFSTLEVAFQLVHAGGATAGKITFQHAAADEEDLYTNVGSDVNLYGSIGVTHQTFAFLRYVRWVTSGNVDGAPLASIEIIAKEH
jgi:hypothetical protein